jgi:hypothetical protein
LLLVDVQLVEVVEAHNACLDRPDTTRVHDPQRPKNAGAVKAGTVALHAHGPGQCPLQTAEKTAKSLYHCA